MVANGFKQVDLTKTIQLFMQLTHHCELCDHQKVNLKEGSICSLTERKPNFHRTCLKISLTKKFEEKLKLANIEYQRVQNDKWWTYAYAIVFLTISFAVFYGAYWFVGYVDELFESRNSGQSYITVVPIVIFAIGFVLLAMAVGAFNKYRKDVAKVTLQKQRIDEVLSLYNISYVIEITFEKKYHGKQEVAVDLKLKGINL